MKAKLNAELKATLNEVFSILEAKVGNVEEVTFSDSSANVP